LTVGWGDKPMPAWTEMLGDGAIGREKTLGVPRGFKPLPPLFPLASRSM
jgi:hypothetical protein